MSLLEQVQARQGAVTSKVADSLGHEKVTSPADRAKAFRNNLPVVTTSDYPAPQEGQLLPRLEDVTQHVYIRALTRIYDTSTEKLLPFSDFVISTANYPPVDIGGKMVPWSTAWIRNTNRPEFLNLTYNPGYTGTELLNRWKGWPYEPIKGTVEPFLKVLRWVVGSEHEKTVLQWFAYPLQNPGKRSLFALVLISNAHGVGKGLIVKTIGKLHGEGFKTPSVSMVTGEFNAWLAQCTLAGCEEFSTAGNRNLTPKIKECITEPQIMLNEKNCPAYMSDNIASFVFLSNDHAALHIEPTDRRFYVIDCKNQAASAVLYDEFIKWRDAGGYNYLMHYLLNLDMTGYKASGHAPATADKEAMADLTATDLERWLLEFSTAAPKAIYTRLELRLKFEDYSGTHSTESAVGRALKRLGLGAECRVTSDNGKDRPRVVTIRDPDVWRGRGAAAWAAEYYAKKSA